MNGSSWTEVNDLSRAKNTHGQGGTTTSALAYGGYDGSGPSNSATSGMVQEWTVVGFEAPSMNQFRGLIGADGASNTACIAVGGFVNPPTGRVGNTEIYGMVHLGQR